tara:strand:+ start:225 stop:482 length:258 start_codon:yes stop_codon:yes gene_type:complete
MNLNFSTKEKCLLRDLITIEIRNCSNDFNLISYVERLKKLKYKIQLDNQQLKKAVKIYGNDIEEITNNEKFIATIGERIKAKIGS